MDRRKFFSRMTMFLGGAISAVLGWNMGRYFISPIWEKREDDFIPLCSLVSLPKGKPFSIEYVHREKDGWETHDSRNSLWLVRDEKNDEVVAFDKSCTHLGCPYDWKEEFSSDQLGDSYKGVPFEGAFLCPCHTATFAKDGKVLSGPPERSLDYFPVKVENGMVLVKPETIKGEKV